MDREQRLKAAEEHARKVCGEYYDLMYENEPDIEYSMGQLCTDDFIAGAEAEAESKNLLTDEEMRKPIEDALYSTKHFLTTQSSELADGILLCLKEAGYSIIKTP